MWSFTHSRVLLRGVVAMTITDVIFNTTAISVYMTRFDNTVFISFTQGVWTFPSDFFMNTRALNGVRKKLAYIL